MLVRVLAAINHHTEVRGKKATAQTDLTFCCFFPPASERIKSNNDPEGILNLGGFYTTIFKSVTKGQPISLN